MSSPMRSNNLSSLTPREAIIDALYRAIIAWDRHDIPAFNSSFAEDATVEIGTDGTRVYQGIETIRTQLFDFIGPMDSTHMVQNVRVDVKDGASTAQLTAYILAQHCPPGMGKVVGAPKFLVAGEYWVDLVRDEGDGLWRAKRWVVDQIWTQGDASVMARHP